MPSVTIRDVAKEAGVSTATVSYVLNDSRRVGGETRERVRQAALRLGYRANITARNLQASETRLIGYSWRPTPTEQFNPIVDKFLQSIAEAAARHDYRILAFPSMDVHQELSAYEEMMLIGQVDGFILTNTNFDDERVLALVSNHFPFVSFGRANQDWDFLWIDVDGAAGVLEATRHLVSQGHLRIAFLAWPEKSQTGHYRLQGYLNGMEEAGLAVDTEWIQLAGNFYEESYAATQRLLALPLEHRPSAVIASSDLMALGVLNAAWNGGLEVGRDMAVIGFDDAPIARYMRPALTSLAQPVDKIGDQLVSTLIDELNGQPIGERQVLMQPTLVVRASSATPYSDRS
ncbi:MAG: LacI family DNA-binding transcriptional regulator [Caldilineae bacterium]|nr:LacI family DNA-binding transcriptional regulator [Anaerolineae bacterium]MCB0199936.1 LacI family DNA-binding transcriptional regulator [Anaerolineae bacterium]MCB0203854.1 LacI family DNA-binding transcriptional regulator [Anaerolineae bacterium]MCB0253529.1 LacI family DNA-binding transcriptional regulator [Anaerolineae bacterium]MCB9152905.1 LacI family DNA-binding transcriptional regulator [Caldilineae bacterium]